MEEWLESINEHEYAYLIRIALSDVELSDIFYGCPYIAKAKCEMIDNGTYDNGRVLSCDRCIITITDIDLKILLSQYSFSAMAILDLYKSRYGYLPKSFRNLVLAYYEEKTKLKGDVENEVYYNKSKALLNSLYGLSAQNPMKPTIIYKEDEFSLKDEEEINILKKYNHTAFLPYQWGVWVTAYAREQLENGIRYVLDNGGEFLYTDTDSIKYYGDVDLNKLNRPLMEYAEKHNMYADDNKGHRHYLGVWESEYDGGLKEFIHLGAKKYGYRDKDGVLHITIAGVNKKKGAKELEEMGGLEAFRIGTVFRESGGNEVIYNDENYGQYDIDGHQINIIKNVVIKPSTYTLGITNEYAKLLYECGELDLLLM